jgi:Fe-S cluster assembly protein SufD
MSAWLESALLQAKKNLAEPVESSLLDIQKSSLAALQGARWPTRKVEAWKYTSLFELGEKVFQADSDAAVSAPKIDDAEFIDISFCSGRWVLDAVSELPSGLSIHLFTEGCTLPAAFNAIKPERHLFGQLNDCLLNDVLIISTASGAVIDTPVRLHIENQAGQEQQARAFVSVASESSLTVVESLAGKNDGLSVLFSEYDVAAHAALSHYRLQLQTAASYCIGGAHFDLAEKSKLDSQIVGFGSKLSRLDIDVKHAGEHAFAKMNAIYLLDGEEHFDLHTCVEHAVPHGTTEENIRGIVADRSQAVFNGRIHIHRDAQKTLAEMNNRNLLLSRRAQINTKPELEIYADDVKCAHGATVAEVNQTAVYYLMSRGISRNDALVMLNFGFINELVDQMPNQAIAQWLRPQLRERFAAMKVE